MNLNDPVNYKVIIFKKKIFYATKAEMMVRDVFFQYTKDGVKPNLGIQEIFLLNHDNYEKVMETSPNIDRDLVRKLSHHSFTVNGYRKNNPEVLL